MTKQRISTPKAPAALGPYSQGVASGNLLFVSGQTPIDPATGALVAGDIEAATRQVIKNIQAILQAAGADLEHVLKTTVFLTDMGNFKRMNAVYAEYFTGTPPARSTIQVSALPMSAEVEIEAIARLPEKA
ncbi:RidA family protein [Desulfocurvibacter africanus]|uniref:Endoribonuclease L-PSP n=2 Tax=Desulfocurvibacter africanus TaxID=873 RepID=F3Z1C7_DESAF|nr:RidA family protein [Desulfocurvibacter africanus]EGJ51130.1 endoribonuclease L-PSP [Desulfocurvibacter africanus subsp. africanus str. Walvis Bay]EMG39027.1 endoribonuclease L-PSP [Desulfocurvibacter africanus PCS]